MCSTPKISAQEMQDKIQDLQMQVDAEKARCSAAQRQVEEEKERHLCKICYASAINTVILDCKHQVMCSQCARQVRSCPVCRAPVKQVLQTYAD